jgi:hypothetical protein
MDNKRFFVRLVEPESEWDTYRHEVVERIPDGKGSFKERVLGMDGGEPEDQTLYRNWSWVVEALNKAYEDGVDEGASNPYC